MMWHNQEGQRQEGKFKMPTFIWLIIHEGEFGQVHVALKV